MRGADWTSLVYSVERGMCTLMLGPESLMGTLDGRRMPVNVALASFVKDKLGPAYAGLDESKLASVAQAAVALEDPFTLQGWVEEFYESFDGDLTLLQTVAQLPFDLVINSSPGFSAHRVFSEFKPETKYEFYDRTARARPMLPDLSVAAPVVYDLYGSLEQPSSLILSDNDRLDFVVSVVSEQPPLPPKLKSTLCDPDRTFLFLGFDLAQWQFRVLLHVLAGDVQRRYKSFALEFDSQAVDTDTRDFYRAGHKIHFVGGDLAAFAKELQCRVRLPDIAEPETSPDDDGLPPDSPVAFLCHVSEDKPFVQAVADGLRANGINTWFDRDDLRGGDRWDSKIRQTIAEEIDYFVVLQSASLRAKDIGYVNREIELALDRQQFYRAPRCFMIPTIVDHEDSRLPGLRHLQSVDLSDPSGIDSLVRTIKRDVMYKVRQGT